MLGFLKSPVNIGIEKCECCNGTGKVDGEFYDSEKEGCFNCLGKGGLNMKNKIIIYAIALMLCSCSIQKQSAKTKTSTIDKKDFVSETFRTITEKFEGEELSTDILPVSERQKDDFGNLKEFFTTQKEGNLKKTIHYKKDGNVSVQVKQLDLTRVIQEAVKTEDKGTTETDTLEKTSEKKEAVSGSIFIWIAFAVFGSYIAIKEYNGYKRKT